MLVIKGKSVNARFYKTTVLRKLKKYFKNRRPTTGLASVNLQHGNVSSHKASIVQDFLKPEKVAVLPHPPYLPDLSPCDFSLFPRLKKDFFMVEKFVQTTQFCNIPVSA